MFALAALLAAAALFIAALALFLWVTFHYWNIALSLGSAILSELRSRPVTSLSTQPAASTEAVLGSQLKQFIKDRMSPTEGDFVTNSDEELFIQEQVKNLRDQGNGGISEEELQAFVRQAVSDKV